MKTLILSRLAVAGFVVAQTYIASASAATYTNPILNKTGADP